VGAVVPLIEDDGVESVPAGLYPDVLQDVVSSVVRQGQTVNEHLRDGLQGERSVVIAGLICIASGADDAYAEPVAFLGGGLWPIVPAPRLVVARDALFSYEQVPSVQLLKTLGYTLAIGGSWHASSPPSGFSCIGFRILAYLSARCADTPPEPLSPTHLPMNSIHRSAWKEGSRKFEKFGYESPLGEIRRWVKTEYPVRP
jgi:hypothetical protein